MSDYETNRIYFKKMAKIPALEELPGGEEYLKFGSYGFYSYLNDNLDFKFHVGEDFVAIYERLDDFGGLFITNHVLDSAKIVESCAKLSDLGFVGDDKEPPSALVGIQFHWNGCDDYVSDLKTWEDVLSQIQGRQTKRIAVSCFHD